MMMALATAVGPGGPRLMIRVASRYYDVIALAGAAGVTGLDGVTDVGSLVRQGREALDAVRRVALLVGSGQAIGDDELVLLPPVLRPGKVVCVGLNYPDQTPEDHGTAPRRPVLFAKLPTALTGHRAPIVHHALTAALDYEGELAVVIGQRCSRVDPAQALRYVGAYTILNDVSARDLQAAEPQWIRAKSLDTFAPMGPCAVIPDEGFDPARFRIRTTVSGELRQDASCGDMVNSVAELIAFVSEAITLEPGDIISTGTPGGVGLTLDPPRYLSVGDTVSVEIDGIGILTNTVVAA